MGRRERGKGGSPTQQGSKAHTAATLMASSSDVHRNICQLLLDEGVKSEEDLLDNLGECIDRHKESAKRARVKLHDDVNKNAATLESIVQVINDQLQPLGFKVARMKSQVTGEWARYY